MNSYELLRSDRSGTGIWVCGKCGRIHLRAWKGLGGATETNRASAELCCAPRDCKFCGLPTEPNSAGQFPYAHQKCIPPVVTDPPHPSMANPYARLLYHRMSDISEECWSAGWELGTEYALWRMLQGGRRAWGRREVSPDEIEELARLSDHAAGWIWTGGAEEFTPQLVSFEEWSRLLSQEGDELKRSHEAFKEKGFFWLPEGWKPGDPIP